MGAFARLGIASVLAVSLLFAVVDAQAATLGGELVTTLGAQQKATDWDVSAQSLLRLQYRAGTYPWRLYVDGSARLSHAFGASDWDADYAMERYYVKGSVADFDFNIGRQQISWGVGYAWAPTDLFNPPNPQDPQGRRQGVDALVVRMPTGPLGYWSAVVARRPESAATTHSDWQYAVRRQDNLGGADWSVLAIRDSDTTVLGGDIKLDYGPSWTAEAAYFLPNHGPSRWESVIGADYSWFDGHLVWRGEYLYNSAGATDPAAYDYMGISRGDLKHLARQYMFHQLSGQIDLFSTVNASVLANLVDGSSLWTLAGQTELSGDWRLLGSVTLPAGDAGDEFALGPKLMAKVQAQYAF